MSLQLPASWRVSQDGGRLDKVVTALLRVGKLLQQLDHQRMTEAELTVDVCTCTEGRRPGGWCQTQAHYTHLSLTSIGDEGQV